MLDAKRLEECRSAWERFHKKHEIARLNLPRPPRSSRSHRLDLRALAKKLNILLSADEKIAILREMASRQYQTQESYESRRNQYVKTRHRLVKLSGCECYVCGAPATVRHHIIQLQNGGRNSPRNLMGLCDDCHAEIHPWLREGKGRCPLS